MTRFPLFIKSLFIQFYSRKGIKNTTKTTPPILKSRKYKQTAEPKLEKAGKKKGKVFFLFK
jgi:hypothetical protein